MAKANRKNTKKRSHGARRRTSELTRTMRRLDRHKKKNPTLQVEFFVVAFIDLLGQSNALRELDHVVREVHEVGGDNRALVSAIYKVCRPIEAARIQFADYFDGAMNWSPSDPRWNSLSGSAKRKIKRAMSVDVRSQVFSDCLVFAVSLRDSKSHDAVGGVLAILQACAAIMPVALAGSLALWEGTGMAIRGGVGIGPGASYFPDEITTSAAFVQAYELESRHADYPRIIVSEEVATYLESVRQLSPSSPTIKFQIEMATQALALLARSADGNLYVDYLSPAALEMHAASGVEVLPDAYRFARLEYDRFHSDGNYKIASKYKRLVADFDTALPHYREQYNNGELPTILVEETAEDT